jgi:uncharacterized nucleotidyltransferase DUF6036
MNSDFKDLLSLLDRFGVRYLVVGGYAVMLYTEPRYTKDIDIFVGASEDEIESIGQVFAEFGFPMTSDLLAQLKLPNRMISIGRAPSRIDLLNAITGVDFEGAWERRNLVQLEGLLVSFLSLQDLVDAKHASGRPQDLLDLQNLEPLLLPPGGPKHGL